MTSTLAWMQRHFWLPMVSAVVLGMLVPRVGEAMTWTFKPALMIILTLVFAKIDLAEVLHHIRSPRLMVYLVGVQRLVLPLVVYYAIRPLNGPFATGALLLACMPPAASSPVFCDLVHGNTALCVSLYAVSYLAAPVTITLVLGLLTDAQPPILPLFTTVALLIFVPILLAQLAKRWWQAAIDRHAPSFGGVNLLVVCYLIFAIVSSEAIYFRTHVGEVCLALAALYLFFGLLHWLGYLLCPRRPVADRLAVSISTTYMNTALAVVLAKAFFPPAVIVVAVASEIPWSTMLGPFRWAHGQWVARQSRLSLALAEGAADAKQS